MIYNTDCLQYLRATPDKVFDITFYDPPYNVKKDYGAYKDHMPAIEYMEWMKAVANECIRVSKRGIIVYVAGKLLMQFTSILPMAHVIVVHKKASGVCSGGYQQQYHLIFSIVKPIVKCRDIWDDIRLPGEGYYFHEKRYANPGMTGLKLTERVLEHFTNVGDSVFDPFSGVGTTAVACKNMNRNFTGTELNADYITIANSRLQV